jgi:hypothetical protein
MPTYAIDLKNKHKTIVPNALELGGSSPRGDRISFSNYYMEWNGQPFFGIAGEFHFSRYPAREWETEIARIKLGGVNVLSTYIFWIHHEEEEGIFNWEGNRNLRYFVDLCAKQEIHVILRVGPFAHGECRNGGLPDWLYGRPFEVRSNDSEYLDLVRRLYGEIGRQVQGQFFQDGGPIIGIQIENEFMHAGAPWEMVPKQTHEWVSAGSGGVEHMQTLKEMAVAAGLIAPIYTSTGWGGAPVLEGEILPLYGGYAFCPWNVTEQNPVHAPTAEYLPQSFHDNQIPWRGPQPPYLPESVPFACCEMGGGMQVWYRYRFEVPPESVIALALHKIAGGCNFIGYYMYHGGSNPIGKHAYLNEHVTPKISYDFQAPLGEFGQVRASYRGLKPLHIFLQDFAGLLCPMGTVLPEGAARLTPTDTEHLRFSVRTQDGSGFVFLMNYQDHVGLCDLLDLHLRLELEAETIAFPAINLQKGVCAVLPFNLDLDGIRLKFATTQLITRLASTYFFFAPDGIDSQYCFERAGLKDWTVEGGQAIEDGPLVRITVASGKAGWVRLTTRDGHAVDLCTLTQTEAWNLWKVRIWGQERIVISPADLLTGPGYISLSQSENPEMCLSLFPDVDHGLAHDGEALPKIQEGIFASYSLTLPAQFTSIGFSQPPYPNKMTVNFTPDAFFGFEDLLLQINYTGDVGYAYLDGQLISDNFNNGTIWEIGLSRFLPQVLEKEIYLYVTPQRKGKVVRSNSAMAAQETFVGEEVAEIRSVWVVPRYKGMVVEKRE